MTTTTYPPHFSVLFGHASAAPVWDDYDHFMRYDYDAVEELGSVRMAEGFDTYVEAISAAKLVVEAFGAAAGPTKAVVMVTVGDWDGWSFMCRTWESPAEAVKALSDLLADVTCAA